MIIISRIFIVVITTYAILIQPLIDFEGNDNVVVYNLLDLEQEPNSNEEKNEEEVQEDNKIENQFTQSAFIEKNRKIGYYIALINSVTDLEIHSPPPDFL